MSSIWCMWNNFLVRFCPCRLLAVGAFFLFLSLLSPQLHAASFSGKLVRVIDGDTLEVLNRGSAERIRLTGIDCPERNQPFGQAAKQYVINIAAGRIVKVVVTGQDRYDRTLGEVILPSGLNLNAHLVGKGYAWHYKQYSDDAALEQLENNARNKRIGLWQDKNPTPPWIWRRQKRP